MNFAELGLSPDLLRAVADTGYENPTPIQAQAIPHILAGRDVLGSAQTGSGKTASFTLPMLDILASGRARARMPRTLILEPTRELATQVAENFDTYGKYIKLDKALLIGGVSYGDQNQLLDRGVDVLIATPGRLLDHFERGRILMSDVKILVIDEADRMLDMGFIPDVQRIVKMLPRNRQTLFFSATLSREIRGIAAEFLNNPKEIAVDPLARPADTVTHSVVIVPASRKRDVLLKLLRQSDLKNALIFCNRKRDVADLHRSLSRHGFNAGALHGDMDQTSRLATLDAFRNGEIALLVASDVAARGLDIADLSHVFNFDVPLRAEDYVHRIGRTGRAGRRGQAFTVASPGDARYLGAIEALIGKAIDRITVADIDSVELDEEDEPRRGKRRESRGNSPSDKPAEKKAARAAKPEREPGRQPKSKPKGEPKGEPKRRADRPGKATGTATGKAGDKKRDNSRRSTPAEGPVVGLGDHVPNFLLNPPDRGGGESQ